MKSRDKGTEIHFPEISRLKIREFPIASDATLGHSGIRGAKTVKTLLLIVIMAVIWLLPTPVRAGSNQVDLDGKGLSHQSQAGQNALKSGRQANDLLRAQQGKKALANQADMQKAMKSMNKVKMPKATKPDI
jgi:hypothetical protein